MPRINVKKKGNQWERDAAEYLNSHVKDSKWKRIPMSGAIGTILNEEKLIGDIVGAVSFTNRGFKMDAKVGYGGDTQLTVKKEWFNKIKEEAERSYSFPALICKFSGAKKDDGIQYFVATDIDSFCAVMNVATDLYNEVVALTEKLNEK